MINKIHSLTWHDGVELLDVELHGHPFGKHSHDRFAIGVIESGVGGNVYRGEKCVLPPKTLSLMNPDELHDGFAVSEQLKYKSIYITDKSMQAFIGDRTLHGFRQYTADDADGIVMRSLSGIGRRLDTKNHAGWRLAIDTELTSMLEALLLRHSKTKPMKAGQEPNAVRIIKEYLDSLCALSSDLSNVHFIETVTLTSLADLVDLNPNYLLNIFTRHVGVPPYAYWMTRRIAVSKKLLTHGWSKIRIAQELGFHDQAHFTRAFKRTTGVTPGQFVAHR
jgi:AraC-like DNA-binding protein